MPYPESCPECGSTFRNTGTHFTARRNEIGRHVLLELGCQNTTRRFWWDFTTGNLTQDGRPSTVRRTTLASNTSAASASNGAAHAATNGHTVLSTLEAIDHFAAGPAQDAAGPTQHEDAVLVEPEPAVATAPEPLVATGESVAVATPEPRTIPQVERPAELAAEPMLAPHQNPEAERAPAAQEKLEAERYAGAERSTGAERRAGAERGAAVDLSTGPEGLLEAERQREVERSGLAEPALAWEAVPDRQRALKAERALHVERAAAGDRMLEAERVLAAERMLELEPMPESSAVVDSSAGSQSVDLPGSPLSTSAPLKEAFVRQLQLDRLTLRQMRSWMMSEEARRAIEVAAGATEATYERLALILFGVDLPQVLGKQTAASPSSGMSAEERLELQRERARIRARLRRATAKAARQPDVN